MRLCLRQDYTTGVRRRFSSSETELEIYKIILLPTHLLDPSILHFKFADCGHEALCRSYTSFGSVSVEM